MYAESLGRNLALSGDPFDEFGLLYSELQETSKVVVDTGIHALGFAVYSLCCHQNLFFSALVCCIKLLSFLPNNNMEIYVER